MKTILVADDDQALRRLVSTTLDRPEVRIIEAVDGEAAIETARSELPDVILLDWMMPRVDGLGVLHDLKGDDLTRGIPVVMLTARASPDDQAEGEAAGAHAFLTKPFSPLELMELIEELLGEPA